MRAAIAVPAGRLQRGPRGHRFHVVDVNVGTGVAAPPVVLHDRRPVDLPRPLHRRRGTPTPPRWSRDREFRAQNVYAVAAHTLALFEQYPRPAHPVALGPPAALPGARRPGWRRTRPTRARAQRRPLRLAARAPRAIRAVHRAVLRRDRARGQPRDPRRAAAPVHRARPARPAGVPRGAGRPRGPAVGVHPRRGRADTCSIREGTRQGAARRRGARRPTPEQRLRGARHRAHKTPAAAAGRTAGRPPGAPRRPPTRTRRCGGRSSCPRATGGSSDPAFAEPHRRAEVLVAAFMQTFVTIWAAGSSPCARTPTAWTPTGWRRRASSRPGTCWAWRCAPWTTCRPVELEFADVIDAVLTADQRLAPDDDHHYRDALRAHVRRFRHHPARAPHPRRRTASPRRRRAPQDHPRRPPTRRTRTPTPTLGVRYEHLNLVALRTLARGGLPVHLEQRAVLRDRRAARHPGRAGAQQHAGRPRRAGRHRDPGRLRPVPAHDRGRRCRPASRAPSRDGPGHGRRAVGRRGAGVRPVRPVPAAPAPADPRPRPAEPAPAVPVRPRPARPSTARSVSPTASATTPVRAPAPGGRTRDRPTERASGCGPTPSGSATACC